MKNLVLIVFLGVSATLFCGCGKNNKTVENLIDTIDINTIDLLVVADSCAMDTMVEDEYIE